MSGKSQTTRDVDARTNQPVQPLQFNVNSHDDYLRLREVFRHLPKIPTLLRPEEQPTATAANFMKRPRRRAMPPGNPQEPAAQRGSTDFRNGG
jgi:hypothetical protein